MHKKRVVLALLIGLMGIGFSSSAFAEKTVTERQINMFKKKTVIDFNDVQIEGELVKPEGSYGMAVNKAKFKSLIKLRQNFNPELQKSVDHL